VSRQTTQADYYAENREEIIAKVAARNRRPEVAARRRAQSPKWQRTYREKVGRDTLNARARARYTPEYGAAANRRQKFGLTPEDFAALVASQDGRCAACGDLLDFGTPRMVHVDHDRDHCTGRKSCGKCIRGVLCLYCNIGIARFKHDPVVMRRVADWLEAADAKVAERTASAPTQEELPLGPGAD
jgi:hypothetical protein